jgi:hypothetical protein
VAIYISAASEKVKHALGVLAANHAMTNPVIVDVAAIA